MGKHAKMVAEIEKRIGRLPNEPGQCLYIAHHAVSVLQKHGQYAVIQAGSLQWPRLRPEDDDGVVDTHFSYMWSPLTPASVVAMEAGQLPEMHVWAGLPDEQIIVDFSTRHLPTAAARLGMAWTAAEPPQYLWCSARAVPAAVVYRPNREATLLACRILKRFYKPAWLD
jgi:hypothetical protein